MRILAIVALAAITLSFGGCAKDEPAPTTTTTTSTGTTGYTK
jgi:hypothetical protein